MGISFFTLDDNQRKLAQCQFCPICNKRMKLLTTPRNKKNEFYCPLPCHFSWPLFKMTVPIPGPDPDKDAKWPWEITKAEEEENKYNLRVEEEKAAEEIGQHALDEVAHSFKESIDKNAMDSDIKKREETDSKKPKFKMTQKELDNTEDILRKHLGKK